MTQAYVYKWTHIPTLKWYVGSRTAKGCHPDDSYICSSKIVKPLIQANPEKWRRDIIEVGDPLFVRDLEAEILETFDATNDPRSFNKNNANGKFTTTRLELPHKEETKKKIGLAQKGRNQGLTYEQIHGVEKAKKLKDNLRSKPGPNLGKKLSNEAKNKLSVAAKNRPPVTDETKLKMSLSGRGKSKKLSIEEVKDIKYNLRAKDAILKYPKVSETTITRIRTGVIWKHI